MRDRDEIVSEIHDARRDLAENLDALRDAVEEKLDPRILLEKRLAPLAHITREHPKAIVGIAVAAGALLALIVKR